MRSSAPREHLRDFQIGEILDTFENGTERGRARIAQEGVESIPLQPEREGSRVLVPEFARDQSREGQRLGEPRSPQLQRAHDDRIAQHLVGERRVELVQPVGEPVVLGAQLDVTELAQDRRDAGELARRQWIASGLIPLKVVLEKVDDRLQQRGHVALCPNIRIEDERPVSGTEVPVS